jgi:hypothetical protein
MKGGALWNGSSFDPQGLKSTRPKTANQDENETNSSFLGRILVFCLDLGVTASWHQNCSFGGGYPCPATVGHKL